MKRFDVLDRSLDIEGNHFLEASAGTGKTFAIEHIVARLILSGKTIDQILVVTFTKAAARELKLRIRRNLEKALNGDNPPDYLREGSLRPIEEALANFDRAQIFTIHGFCYRMLRDFAFEAKAGFELNDPDDSEHKSVVEQAVLHFLRNLQDYSPRQLQAVLRKNRYDFHSFSQKLMRLLESGAEISPSLSFSELYRQFQGMILFIQVEKDKFLEDFSRLIVCYKKMTGAEVQLQAEKLAAILAKKECSQEEFDELLKEKDFFLGRMGADNQKVKASLPASLHYPGLFDILRGRLLPIIKAAADPVKIFLRMAADCKTSSKHFFQAQEKMPPDEILRKMKEALREPPFVSQVREKYRAAIVDEFQDTDPIQWEIFSALFKETSLYLVGDPKQSIYAFRSADLYTYLKAADALGEGSRSCLDTNFRSDPSLVHALNTFFSLSDWIKLPGLNRSLPYMPVHPRKDAQDYPFSDGKGSIHFFSASGSAGREKSWPTHRMEEELLFPFIAQEITGLPFQRQQNVILVKDRFQAERLHLFLKRHNIPAVFRRGGNLLDSPAFAAMEEFLQAIRSPDDSNAVKRVLAGPLIGWTAEQLQNAHEAMGAFFSLHNTLIEKGFGAAVQEFLLCPWGGQLLLRPSSLYADFRQMTELLLEEDDPLHYMGELKKADPESDDRLRIRQEDDDDRVSIMTVHMSKGLEFDTVFALALASRHSHQEDFVKVKGERIVPFEDTEECLKAIEEQEAEKLRQLYVALTRAKRRVYIPILTDPAAKNPSSPIEVFLGASLFDDFYDKLKQTASVSYTDLSAANLSLPTSYTRETITLIPPALASISIIPCRIISFSSLASKENSHEKIVITDPIKSPHTLPIGSETGTILHRILEKIFPYSPGAARSLIEAETVFTHLQGWEEVIEDMIAKILTLTIDNFTLLDIPVTNMQAEVEFLYPHNNDLLKGFADLLFEMNGKYYLLDWKSNWLGPSSDHYTQPHLEKAMRDHDYFLQASIYTEALQRYVKLFDNRPFSECFGGALYIFVRGPALYTVTSQQ